MGPPECEITSRRIRRRRRRIRRRWVAGSVSFVDGSGYPRNRAIQHYLVRVLFWPVGPKEGLFWPKPASFLAKKPAPVLPWFPCIPCIPCIPVQRVALYLWSFLIAFEPALAGSGIHGNTREYTGIHQIRPYGPYKIRYGPTGLNKTRYGPTGLNKTRYGPTGLIRQDTALRALLDKIRPIRALLDKIRPYGPY